MNTEIPKKPILVDSKNTVLIKYLKSRGAQVKIINNTGGLNKLLDIYIDDKSYGYNNKWIVNFKKYEIIFL